LNQLVHIIHAFEAIKGPAFQSEAMGLYLGAACKLSSWNEPPEKNASAELNTQHGIEAVRLCASRFQARPSIDPVSQGLL
jgi:hypothetical protein